MNLAKDDWYYDRLKDHWVLFLPYSEAKLTCADIVTKGARDYEFSYKTAIYPSEIDPTLACSSRGGISVYCPSRAHKGEREKLFAMDRKGIVRVLDPEIGLSSADFILSKGIHIRTATNLPLEMKTRICKSLDSLEAEVNRLFVSLGKCPKA